LLLAAEVKKSHFAGGKAAKLGLPIHAAFSAFGGIEEYNTCMAQ
jgi:hypothetical protein